MNISHERECSQIFALYFFPPFSWTFCQCTLKEVDFLSGVIVIKYNGKNKICSQWPYKYFKELLCCALCDYSTKMAWLNGWPYLFYIFLSVHLQTLLDCYWSQQPFHLHVLSRVKRNYYSPNTTGTYLTNITCTSCSSEFFNIWKLQGMETVVRKVTAECLQNSVGVFLIEQHIVKLNRNTFNTFRIWIM